MSQRILTAQSIESENNSGSAERVVARRLHITLHACTLKVRSPLPSSPDVIVTPKPLSKVTEKDQHGATGVPGRSPMPHPWSRADSTRVCFDVSPVDSASSDGPRTSTAPSAQHDWKTARSDDWLSNNEALPPTRQEPSGRKAGRARTFSSPSTLLALTFEVSSRP